MTARPLIEVFLVSHFAVFKPVVAPLDTLVPPARQASQSFVIAAKAYPFNTKATVHLAMLEARREPVLVLDRIGNVHNLGAIARTAAFLGAGRLVLCGGSEAARPVDAAYRVAEGGLEAVELHAVPEAATLVRGLVAAGYGEFAPLEDGTSEDVLRRNRRIELKLTNR